jgi:hypothetical protein
VAPLPSSEVKLPPVRRQGPLIAIKEAAAAAVVAVTPISPPTQTSAATSPPQSGMVTLDAAVGRELTSLANIRAYQPPPPRPEEPPPSVLFTQVIHRNFCRWTLN